MTDGNGGVGVDEQLRHWPADDLTAADDASARAHDLYAFTHEQFVDACGRTRDEGWPTRREQAYVERVEAVHILARRDRFKHAPFVNLRGQRQLHEDAINRCARVEVCEWRKQ